MVRGHTKFQIGKNGLTEGVLESLAMSFKTHKTVRIHLLKNAHEDRDSKKEKFFWADKTADEIVKKLGGNFTYKILGFTIIMRRIKRLV